MIDLETMSNKPDAPIVAIGAVFFNPSTGELGESFYRAVNLKSSVEHGGVIDPGTVMWWMNQSDEARSAIFNADYVGINTALSELNTFIRDQSDPGKLKVWGNGASFDNVILRASYARAYIPCPWNYWNDRDVRTIVAIGAAAGICPRREIPFDGDQHNALDDARHQAKYVSAIWQHLLSDCDLSEV